MSRSSSHSGGNRSCRTAPSALSSMTSRRHNPGITVELVSGPYASTKEQLFAGAASGTMPDVVGLDGAWVNDFASQGVIADLTALMAEADYDDSELASQIQVDGATYMIPVVNFVYPLFTNDALLADAGIDASAPPRAASSRTCGQGDHRTAAQRQRLGPSALARSAQRCTERRDVVGVGVRRDRCSPGRSARRHERRRPKRRGVHPRPSGVTASSLPARSR